MKKSINPSKTISDRPVASSTASSSESAGGKSSGGKSSGSKSSGGVRFPLLFGRSNYMWMLIGLTLIVAGNILMIGNEDIYSFTKITLAPIVIMAGFLVEIYAIMHRPASRS